MIRSPMLRLAVASACALFLELACIRWAGSHVLYLSYVSNLILIAAFLGLGLGAILAASTTARALERGLCSVPYWLLTFLCVVQFADVEVRIDGAEVVYFSNAQARFELPPWILLPALGCLVAALFVSLGLAVGREFTAAKPLVAYSVDIAGSLAGILLFALVSWLGVPAHLWFLLAMLALTTLLPARKPVIASAALATLAIVGVVVWSDADSSWSPYQRISVLARGVSPARAPGDPAAGQPNYRLRVNNVVHQYITDVRVREPFYELAYRAAGARLPGQGDPYLTATPPHADWTQDPFVPREGWGGRVAIIGAGNGTDTAAALAYGAAHVDAVEIDPRLAELGRQLNPNKPFSDARTQLHIMDGRTFMERARGPYDVVVFGLPDSVTLASPYAGLRLESFLFTEQAFASALRLLHPQHGLLVAYNYYRTPWLVDRIANTLQSADGRAPIVLVGPDRNLSAVFIAGPGAPLVDPKLGRDWGFTRAGAPDTSVGHSIDDWPFLYLRERAIPRHIAASVLATIALGFAAVFWVMRRANRAASAATAPPPSLRALAPFFFMGAAFLLLETSGLVRMSLLFGSTWLVNALVFGAVLCMVLIANGLAHLLPLRSATPIFVSLLGALALAFWLPPSVFSGWSALPKYAASSAVLFAPILLGNLAFSRSFRTSAHPAQAFGANLLGAVVGGSLENLALITGYRALFAVAAVLYVAAWLTAQRAQAHVERTLEPAPSRSPAT